MVQSITGPDRAVPAMRFRSADFWYLFTAIALLGVASVGGSSGGVVFAFLSLKRPDRRCVFVPFFAFLGLNVCSSWRVASVEGRERWDCIRLPLSLNA